MAFCLVRVYKRLTRRKHIKDEDIEKTDLVRCLTTLDLTALGIGSTLGAGAYVLSGQVAKSQAGPAVVLSFLIAAVASILSGLCYSEFGARVPKAGSAYIYTYVTVGEIMAFVIGWNLILEYVIGAASVARTVSSYVDKLIGDVIVPWFKETMPINVPTLTPYFDLLSLCSTLILTVVLAAGVKESATFTKIFTGINLSILSYIIIAGAFKDDPSNWAIPAHMVPNDTGLCSKSGGSCGTGGFMPYGLSGVTKGAATCFFAFVGFDGIASAGEEAANPQKSIPIATIVSLSVVFVVYFGISMTITMMAPYYSLDYNAPFATLFENVGWVISKYIVSIGAMCALLTSLLCVMFPMPRIALAMAQDGLIFKAFAQVSSRFKTPIFATIVTGSLAAIMAALFEIDALVEMMSIGTLLAYTLVSASVLLLRYDTFDEDRKFFREYSIKSNSDSTRAITNTTNSIANDSGFNLHDVIAAGKCDLNLASKNLFARILFPNSPCPTRFSSSVVKILTGFLSFWLIVTCAVLNFGSKYVFIEVTPWGVTLLCVCFLMIAFTLCLINRQPQSLRKLSFTVPFVPFFPAGSMFFNIFLMVNLEPLTWVRFLVWMCLGFAMYFGYGMWHSNEEKAYRLEKSNGKSYEDDVCPSQIALREISQ